VRCPLRSEPLQIVTALRSERQKRVEGRHDHALNTKMRTPEEYLRILSRNGAKQGTEADPADGITQQKEGMRIPKADGMPGHATLIHHTCSGSPWSSKRLPRHLAQASPRCAGQLERGPACQTVQPPAQMCCSYSEMSLQLRQHSRVLKLSHSSALYDTAADVT